MNPTLETLLPIAGSSAGAFSVFALYKAYQLVRRLVETGGSKEAAGLVRIYMAMSSGLAVVLIGASAFLGYNNRSFAQTARAEANQAVQTVVELRTANDTALRQLDQVAEKLRAAPPTQPAAREQAVRDVEAASHLLRHSVREASVVRATAR